MTKVHSYSQASMGWILRKLAGNQMPKEGTITSCDIRAKTLGRVLLLIIVGLSLLAIGFLVLYVAYTFYMSLAFDKDGSRGFSVAILALLAAGILFRNSSFMQAIMRLIDDGVEIFDIEVPGLAIVFGATALVTTIIAIVFFNLSPVQRETLPRFLSDIAEIGSIIAILLDGMFAVTILAVVTIILVRFLYVRTIGYPKTISYTMTNGEVVTATYPWYKAAAIRLSLCTIYEA